MQVQMHLGATDLTLTSKGIYKAQASKEFLTINMELVEVKFYRRKVSKEMRERAEVVEKSRELAVFLGSQLTLSRARSKIGLSTQ